MKLETYLDSFGLVINDVIHSICCIDCQTAILPHKVRRHLWRIHNLALDVNEAQWSEICDKLDVAEGFPQFHGPIEALKHIKVVNGIACASCSKCLAGVRQMRSHHTLAHSDISMPTAWREITMQRLTQHGDTPNFNVTTIKDLPVQSFDMDEQLLAKAHNDLIVNPHDCKDATTPDERMVSPWHLTTGWHHHVRDFDPSELQTLVENPKAIEFPGLAEAVRSYMSHASDLLDVTDELVLERLNTPNPERSVLQILDYSTLQQELA